MKDDVQDSHANEGLLPCSMSSRCLRFIDELSERVPQEGLTLENTQDVKLLEQLRIHVPTCQTCTATVATASRAFTQQSRALHAILDEGEQKVPSTTANIMAAIQQEQQMPRKASIGVNNRSHEIASSVPFPQMRELETPRPKRPKRTLYNALALTAVAAMLVASFGLLRSILPSRSSSNNSSAMMSSPTETMTKYTPFIPGTTATWAAVIIAYKIKNTTVIANYDPISGKYTTLVTSLYADTSVNGVSHHGQMLLYSVYNGVKTTYYVYSQSTTDAIYTTPGKSSSAIWSTDDSSIFISTAKGVAQIDTWTHEAHLILPALASTKLLNYRNDGYLYFVKGYRGQLYSSEGTFNRVNIAQGSIQQITPCERGANFWLSPSGITVYYNCPDQDATLLYAVGSDGTNPHAFSFNAGNVIGYAENGSPLTLVNASGKYQVIQRDVQSAQEKVLLEDVAPGATTVTVDDVAVAPLGHTLVAKGIYGSSGAATQEQFWYGNLVTGKSKALALPQVASTANAIGWDKLRVP